MRYAQIRKHDIANGIGVRTSIFVTGCTIGCKNCFNKEYKDFNFGSLWTEEETNQIIENLSQDIIEGLTVLGGEPFDNSKDLLEIIREIRNKTDKSIWIFSGHVFENLVESETNVELLKLCDVLVDGPFIEEKKNLRLKFRGSENQRIIDLKKTFKTGEIEVFIK